MSAPDPTGHSLLVLIDPAARQADGESVRIAKDVLCAAAATKICLPESAEELGRALARRGGRRPVVVGDDRAFLRVVNELQRQEALGDAPLSLVPVGGSQALAHALGVPTGTVAAARAALEGVERRMGLLVDDDGGVVLDVLRIPVEGSGPVEGPGPAEGPGSAEGPAAGSAGDSAAGGAAGGVAGAAGRQWARARRALAARAAGDVRAPGPATAQVRPAEGGAAGGPAPYQLHVEADGVLLADLDRPASQVRVSADPATGLAEVVVRPRQGRAPLRAEARSVRVWGSDFRYRADVLLGGPVRQRTWTVRPDAWRLITAP